MALEIAACRKGHRDAGQNHRHERGQSKKALGAFQCRLDFRARIPNVLDTLSRADCTRGEIAE